MDLVCITGIHLRLLLFHFLCKFCRQENYLSQQLQSCYVDGLVMRCLPCYTLKCLVIEVVLVLLCRYGTLSKFITVPGMGGVFLRTAADQV